TSDGDAPIRHRRAKNLPDRDRGIRGPAWRQPDEGAAPAARRRRAVRGGRRPVDGARGPDVAVSDRAAVDHGAGGGGEAVADDHGADPANRRRGDGGHPRHPRDHRQSGFHPSGGAAGPGERSLDPDHRTPPPLGVGGLAAEGAAFDLVLPTMPHLQEAVAEGVKGWKVSPRVVVGEQEKRAAFRIARAALAKSGTVTLELAISGVPMVAAYRAGAVEAWIMRSMIQVNSVILANLVVGENVVPEFLQQDCTPEKLSQALREVLGDSPSRRRQIEAFAGIDARLSTGNQPPSVRAADIVLATMRKARRPI